MEINCMKGLWKSLNEFIPEGSSEIMKVSPYGWSIKDIGDIFPCIAYLNIRTMISTVEVSGRTRKTISLNTVLDYIVIEKLNAIEQASS